MRITRKNSEMFLLWTVCLLSRLVIQIGADDIWTKPDESWIAPDPWERYKPLGEVSTSLETSHSTQPHTESCDECMLSSVYYKKLVAKLFDKNALQINYNTGHYQRAIYFSLSKDQLRIIEEAKNNRDIDAVISLVLSTAKVANNEPCFERPSKGFLGLIKEIIKDNVQLFQLCITPEFRFTCLFFGCILLIRYVQLRYKWRLISLLGLVFFIGGYYISFLECNRKLEAESIAEFMKQSQSDAEKGWIQRTFDNIYKSWKSNEQLLELEKQNKVRLPFCRPDHVMMIYFNDIIFYQFHMLIEKLVDMTVVLQEGLPFPYNYLSIVLAPFLLFNLFGLMLPHVMNPRLWRRHSLRENQKESEMHTTDRISGQNLRELLSLLKDTKMNSDSMASSVQEVTEAIEEPSSNEPNNTKSKNSVDLNNTMEKKKNYSPVNASSLASCIL